LIRKPGFSLERRFSRLVFSDRLRYQSLMSDESIENLARKLAESLPEGLRSMREDLETNFRGVLRSGISKLDLVTREEFEVQAAVLARTREKLERLETKLAEYEKTL
jgi:BMFP domain-containing protein YqiC